MSSILYGAEASVETGNILNGLHIVGAQNSEGITLDGSETGVGTDDTNSFVNPTAEFDFINKAVTDDTFDSGTETVSEDAASDITEITTEGEIVNDSFGGDTPNLEFFPDDSNVMGEFGKGINSDSDLNEEFSFEEQDLTAVDNQQGFDIF